MTPERRERKRAQHREWLSIVEALRLEFIEARDFFAVDSDSWAVWNIAAESLDRLVSGGSRGR